MSVLSGLSKSDFKTASDGLLELSEERLRSIMRSEPITDVYHVEQTPFARGKFASVRKIRHLVSGEEYAAKFIRKRRRAADTTREIQHEVAVLALCSGCTRVVSLHEVYETRTEVAIVLELCAGGELQRLLDEEERLTEGAARRALRHVLEGLQHLHARRVAHLDLKPQNLLLSAGGEELLICDFGISRAIQPGAHVREILGTRDYVAPEILSYEPLTLAADIWSVGVLAYVLLSGYSPFAGDTKQETYLNIAQCQLSFPKDLFRGVSGQAIEFIKETLVVDPKGRLTVVECLEHPWLKDATDIPRAIVGAGFNVELASDEDIDLNRHDFNDHSDLNGHGDLNGCGDLNGHGDINSHDDRYGHGDKNSHGNFNGHGDRNGHSFNNGHESHNGVNGHGDRSDHANKFDHGDRNGHGDRNCHGDTNGHGDRNGHVDNGHEDHNGHNGVNGHGVNGYNGTNEHVHEEEKESSRPSSPCEKGDECEERDKPLKHAHARDVSPPFPDAPSTPKVSRKSHPHPSSVLALCKKFQPDYEKPATANVANNTANTVANVANTTSKLAGDCACLDGSVPSCLRLRTSRPPRPPPDRAVLC